MKKALFFIMSLFVTAMSSYAETYFKAGTQWHIESENADFGPDVSTFYTDIYIRLTGDCMVDGYSCTILSQDSDDLGYIRAEGEKVYFRSLNDDSEWVLLYDFGLKEGEWCYVHQISNDKTRPIIVKCVGFEQLDGQEVMIVDSFTDDVALEAGNSDIGSKWIIGGGSIYNVLIPALGDLVGTPEYKLIELSSTGEVIFSQPGLATVAQVGQDARIMIDGTNCCLSGIEPGTCCSVFDIDGIKLISEKADGSDLNLTLPDKGTYIIVIGKQSYKIVI